MNSDEQELMQNLQPAGRQFAMFPIWKKLGWNAERFGKVVSSLVKSKQIFLSVGEIFDGFNEGALAISKLTDEQFETLRSGAEIIQTNDVSSTYKQMFTQTAFKSFRAQAHRSGVKDTDMRYQHRFINVLLSEGVINSRIPYWYTLTEGQARKPK